MPEPHPGCFRAGTLVQLADGRQKRVEDLVPCTPSNPDGGDSLLSVDGYRCYVVALSGGPQPESWQMVEVTASSVTTKHTEPKAHSIVVTRTHSFARAQTNVVQAHFLRRGDWVQSVYGDSVIESVSPVDYLNEFVWNVCLASYSFVTGVLTDWSSSDSYPDKLFSQQMKGSWFGLSPRDHMLFSNGFLTGDMSMQAQLEEVQRRGVDYSSFC